MCGIMGYYCFGDKRPNKDKVTAMFSILETRGRDASGFAFVKGGKLNVFKEAVRSSVLVNKPAWKNLELPRIMIAHTRAKTQGTEKNNKNNHPLFDASGLCIVHNGMIWNDGEIFANRRRDAEVDSIAILEVLSKKKNGDRFKHVFEKLEGSFAFAVIDAKNPDTLTLVKKDNPIQLYYSEYDDILYFCSEREIMQEALQINNSKRRGFSLGEMGYHFYNMENNHVLTINREGVEDYKSYTPRRRSWYTDDEMLEQYYGYNKKKDLNDQVYIQCPYCLEQTKYQLGLFDNRCQHCGMELQMEDELYV